ncbi:hypothetical protein BD770DRAFT_445080 [Pilaira anomala]|nr:hypothetical protein BD770DRAFT_445080 [Pilaira anomala]
MEQFNTSSSNPAVEQQNSEADTKSLHLNEQLTFRYQSALDFLFSQEKITKCAISATSPDKQRRFINFSDRVKKEWIPSNQLLESTGEIKCTQINTGKRDYYTIILFYIFVISLFINVTYGIYQRRNRKKAKNNNLAPQNQAQYNAVPDPRDKQENIAPDLRNGEENIVPNPRNNQEDTGPNLGETQGDDVPNIRDNRANIVPDSRDNQENTAPDPRNSEENIVPNPRNNQEDTGLGPGEENQDDSVDNLSLLRRSRYLLDRLGFIPGETAPDPRNNKEDTVADPRNPVDHRRQNRRGGRRNFNLGVPPAN